MFIWTISGIALASCGGGGGGGSSSGGRARTPTTTPPTTTPDPTPTPDPNPNNSPIILRDTNRNEVGSYTASVDEDAFVGASVVTIDASVDGAAQGSTITYAFVGGATANRDGFWQIGADSGTIINAFDPSGSVLDFETTTSHTLTVRVTYDADGAGTTGEVHTRDVQVVIDVNDVEGIRFKNADGDVVDSYTAPVDEDAFVGASVVTIDASVDGAAQGSTITYAFVGGATANRDGFWQIGADSGTIINAFDPSGSVLDYETAERHTLTVRVTYDSNGATAGGEMHTRDVRVVIDVGNVIDQSEDIILMQDGNVVDSYTASVDEDATAGPALVTIDASVDNAPQVSTIRYNFVGNDQGFAIDSIDGRIIQFTVVLDYETTPRYELTVRVTYDADGDTRTTTSDQETRDVQVVINVNDVPGASPAIIPDRQAFAHQDSYDPDELGLTPMPDADPSAG